MTATLQFSEAVRLNENREFSLPRRTESAPNRVRLGLHSWYRRFAVPRSGCVGSHLFLSAKQKGTMDRYIKCHCQNCGNGIEFQISTLQPGEIRAIDCPHCQKPTAISCPAPPNLKKRNIQYCPDCGNERSRNSISCPRCGSFQLARIIWRFVKILIGIIIILFVLLIVFVLIVDFK